MRVLTLILLLSSLTVAQPRASGGVLLPEQAAIDVLHYDLALTVDPEARSIRGSCAMTARAIDDIETVVLHLDDRLEVSAVTSGDAALEFEHESGLVRAKLAGKVAAGERVTVKISYGGQPRIAPRPPWSGGFTWKKTHDGRPWIATSCQGEGADLWWPCKDHPSDKPETMDLHITVPDGLICASNGVLIAEETTSEGSTFHWKVKNPINNYCVALNIAPYVTLKRTYESVTGEKVPVLFYALPESEKKAEKFLPEVMDHLRHMEEVCGPYPFRNEKYGVAETPHLGMEHQTIIAYGNKYPQRRQFDYDWLHHHEMCHEWWANLVTCRDWKDMWIHEGIGTYMQALYIESRRGKRAYAIEMAQKRRSLANRGPVAPKTTQDSKQIYFGFKSGNDIYYKGSWIMHSMRWLMGDETFFKALRRMAYPDPAKEKVTDGTQVRFSDTDEIRAIAEKHFGSSLQWFFDVYVHQPHLPELVVEENDGKLTLSWKVPDDLPFPMPVPVKVGDEVRRIEMKDGKATVDLGGKAYRVDPDERILKKRPPRRRRDR